MSAVNTKRCTGRQCSPVLRLPTGQSLQNTGCGDANKRMSGCIDRWMDGCKQTHGARAASAVPCCGCLQGSPCSTRDDPGAHGNEWGQMQEGSRHGAKAKAGRQGMARQNKAVVAERPVVKLTGTGLAAKQLAEDPTGTGLAAKTAGR